MKVLESDPNIGYSENTITFLMQILQKTVTIFPNNHIFEENSTITGLS